MVTWTGNIDGSCDVLMEAGPKQIGFLCTYTADGAQFTIDNDDCHELTGVYSYTISEPVLSFTLIDDGCEGRAESIPGDWTRQ